MAKRREKVARGAAIRWFPEDETRADQLAEQMALPDIEYRQRARSEWRWVRDQYTYLLDGQRAREDSLEG